MIRWKVTFLALAVIFNAHLASAATFFQQFTLQGSSGTASGTLTLTNGPPNIPYASPTSCDYSHCTWIQAGMPSGSPVSDVYLDMAPMSQNYTGNCPGSAFTIDGPGSGSFSISCSSDGTRNVGHIVTSGAVGANDYDITVHAGSVSQQITVHAATGTAVGCTGANDQNAIQAQVADGRIILLAACTYHFSGFVTLGNNVMILGQGIGRTIIDGGTTGFGIVYAGHGGGPNGSQGQGDAVANIQFQNFGTAPPTQRGSGDTVIMTTDGWVVRNNLFTNQHSTGLLVQANNNELLANNHFLNIGQQAIAASVGWDNNGTPSSSTPILIIGNETDNVNTDLNDACDTSSGSFGKHSYAAVTQGGPAGTTEVFKNNYIHDNAGPGWWFDFFGPGPIIAQQNTIMRVGIHGYVEEISTGQANHDVSLNMFRYNGIGYKDAADNCGNQGTEAALSRDGSNLHYHDNNITVDPIISNPYGISSLPWVIAIQYDGTQQATNDVFERNTITFVGANVAAGYGFPSNMADTTGDRIGSDRFHYTAGDQNSAPYLCWQGTCYALGNNPATGPFCSNTGMECDATVDTSSSMIATGCTHIACSSAGIGPNGVPQ